MKDIVCMKLVSKVHFTHCIFNQCWRSGFSAFITYYMMKQDLLLRFCLMVGQVKGVCCHLGKVQLCKTEATPFRNVKGLDHDFHSNRSVRRSFSQSQKHLNFQNEEEAKEKAKVKIKQFFLLFIQIGDDPYRYNAPYLYPKSTYSQCETLQLCCVGYESATTAYTLVPIL